MKTIGATALIAFLLAGFAAAAYSPSSAAPQAGSAASVLCELLYNLRFILTVIAAAVGALVIILQGIKWVGSADDPGARKQAKQGIIHAIVGLVIVVLAVWVVTMVITSDECNPSVI